MHSALENLAHRIHDLSPTSYTGTVAGIRGMLIEISGIEKHLSIGDVCRIENQHHRPIYCEVISFDKNKAMAMAMQPIDGVGLGNSVKFISSGHKVQPTNEWLGRIVDGLGAPADGQGPLPRGKESYDLNASPPEAHSRTRIKEKLDLGVRALNTFVTCCQGQRLGIFSGSGVGKSSLLSMIARYTHSDVNVIGLIGERGRELREFIEDSLGAEGLKKSVVIVATSDESPLMRKRAAYLTLTIAEYFRDQGKNVLCLFDSVTRFAMAQREIGLAAGEPPSSKGYTPSVFSELPRLLERAGPGKGSGSITGLFTVLVEGDDHNEPIADAVRGILDGHIVLSRLIAERGRFPAIDVLKSISRTMPGCNDPHHTKLINKAKNLLSDYQRMEELIRIGAYRKGSDPAVDQAITLFPKLEAFLSQEMNTPVTLDAGYAELEPLVAPYITNDQ